MGFQITHMCRSSKNVVQIDQQNCGISTTNKKNWFSQITMILPQNRQTKHNPGG